MFIGRLRAEEIDKVVDLHLAFLTTRLSGRPGRELLRLYYGALANGECGVCLVSREEATGMVQGAGVLRWGGGLMRRALKRNPFFIPFLLVWHVLRRPVTLYHLSRQFWERSPIKELLKLLPGSPRWCLLHALVVEQPGKGIGQCLTQALLEEARSRGFEYMITSTFEGNSANYLYRKSGFSLLLVTEEPEQKVNWYGRALSIG